MKTYEIQDAQANVSVGLAKITREFVDSLQSATNNTVTSVNISGLKSRFPRITVCTRQTIDLRQCPRCGRNSYDTQLVITGLCFDCNNQLDNLGKKTS